MIKPSSLKDHLTGLTLPSLSRWTSLGRESPFYHKVVYNVDDGHSLRQKSIHHERENTMLFSSIHAVNGRPFLRCSVLWRQICRSDYRTLFKQQVFLQQMAPIHLCRHDSLEQLNITQTTPLPFLLKCLVTKLRTNRNVRGKQRSSGVVCIKILMRNGQEWKILD